MSPLSKARTIPRQGPRVVPPALKIAVLRRKLIAPNEHEFCELLDVSQNGIGISSQWLNAKVGQKLDLQFFHDRKTFTARGIITRVTARDKFDQYGIAFIYAPPDLDFLIDLFIRAHPPAQGELPVTTEPLTKLQRANRLALFDAQIYVKKQASSAPMTVCQVDNISQGGHGFLLPGAASQAGTVHGFGANIRLTRSHAHHRHRSLHEQKAGHLLLRHGVRDGAHGICQAAGQAGAT
jgi:hypothetical protein